ncbi:myb/SANT-like DNA-binding domain-containing protein 4 [Linepithema humile]|uniref:myb/SANT-like DNA-binding domain-containing protein 4 n=1 Tax=Linepithema humile TaxID=83485 RepID=UPI00351EC35A
MNVTYKQKEILLDFMSKHIDVVRGRVSRDAESRSALKSLWEEVAETVNSSGQGPMKTSAEWKKCWNDWKMNVLKKESKKRAHMQGTGRGPAVAINISDLEQKLLAILTPEAAGMPNIPEGGLITKTNLNSMISYPVKSKEVAKTSNKPSHVNVQQDVDDSQFPEILQHIHDSSDSSTETEIVEEKKNVGMRLSKIKKISMKVVEEPSNNRSLHLNVQDVNNSQFPEILQYIHDTSNSATETEIVEEKENVEIRPSKIKKVCKKVAKLPGKPPNTDQDLPPTMTNMTLQMLQLQQEKMKIKKEELTVQKELLAVQKEILNEIKDFNAMSDNYFETKN